MFTRWNKAIRGIFIVCMCLSISLSISLSLNAEAHALVNNASLYAGGGAGDNGPATNAFLKYPAAVAVDDNGDLYIADYGNHVVRKVEATTGDASTFAGTLFKAGYSGDGGAASEATLSSPTAVAIRDGYLYIADYGNHAIRRVQLTTRIIEAFAGNGIMAEADNGTYTDAAVGDGSAATSARLNGPTGIAFNSAGDLFIAEETHRVRVVDAVTGNIDTYAGTGVSYFVSANGDGGAALSAKLNTQRGNGIAVDGADNVYVGDSTNLNGYFNGGSIRKIDAVTKTITTVAGGGNTFNANGVSALNASVAPAGMYARGTDLYVYDRDYPFVRRIDLVTGLIYIVAGTGTGGFSGDGGPATAALTHASVGWSYGGVTLDATGNVYFADTKNHRIRKIDSGGTITTVAGGGIGLSGNATDLYLSGTFDNGQMAMDDQNNLYFTDGSQLVFKVDASTGKAEKIAGRLDYWTEYYNGGFSGDGGAAGDAELDRPAAIAVDGDGNVYVYDAGNNRIRKVTKATGIITTIAGNGQSYSDVSGYVSEAADATTVKLADNPLSTLVVDGDGNLYFSEGNSSISLVRKLTPNGDGTYAIGTYAGGTEALSPTATSDQWGDDMPATSGKISGWIQRLALDTDGNLYITSAIAPYLLRKVDADGILHTVAGSTTNATIDDGDPVNTAGTNMNVIALNATGEVFLTTQNSSPATVWRLTEGRYFEYYTNQIGWNKTLAIDSNNRMFIGTSLYSTNNPYGIVALDAPAATTIALESSQPVQSTGQYVTFTATVSNPGNAGWVAFKNGDKLLGVVKVSAGEASYATNGLAEGSHSITARYIGTQLYGDSVSDVLTQVMGDQDLTAPSVTTASLGSSNADVAKAKVGDTVTLSFETDEDVKTPIVTLAGRPATAVPAAGSATEWVAETVMLLEDPEGVIAFSILVEDLEGNEAEPVTAPTDGSAVDFDKTAPAKPVIAIDPEQPTRVGVVATLTYSIDSATKEYKLGNGAWLPYSLPIEITENTTVQARSLDAAGNASETAERTIDNVNQVKPTITLSGYADVQHEAKTPYADAGANAYDDQEEDITARVTVTGEVESDVIGTYTLRYNVADSAGNEADEQTRTVRVVDTTIPIVSLIGGAELSLSVGDSFTDPGATATDNYDGDLTDRISETGTVDTQQPGTYIIAYSVLDLSGNAAAVVKRTVRVLSKGGSDTSTPPATPTSTPTPDNAANLPINVMVNGKAESAGTATSAVDANGQRTITVKVDETKLQQRLDEEGDRAIIAITVPSGSNVAVGELNGRMVKAMEASLAVVEIHTEKATYTLPASQISIDAVSELFGTELALQNIKVKIEIADPSADTIRVVEDAANREGLTLIVPPLNFKVSAVYGDRTVDISAFTAYVNRKVAIPKGVDPQKITTGMVTDPDGTIRHVPTKIVLIDGIYYAEINSLTNSTYSVVWHPLEFGDVSNHWAKDAVNDMGARMVLDGTGGDTFSPSRGMTRAEFAAIMVRGLGLRAEPGAGDFTDVQETAWYSGAIRTAYDYGLIDGFADGTFRPDEMITREQAMLIVSKAMAITALPGMKEGSSAAEVLDSYSDAAVVSSWARRGVADSVSAGLVSGRSNGLLAPAALITRAEAAVIMQRLLQQSDLIN